MTEEQFENDVSAIRISVQSCGFFFFLKGKIEILNLKGTMKKIKHLLQRINSRFEWAEESELEDNLIQRTERKRNAEKMDKALEICRTSPIISTYLKAESLNEKKEEEEAEKERTPGE